MSNMNTLSLRSIFEKDKLNGANFLDWYTNLRIVLTQERKLYVMEQPILEAPPATATRADHDAYKKHQDDALDVSCLMLATMNSELQKQHELMDAYDMVEHLCQLYKGKGKSQAKGKGKVMTPKGGVAKDVACFHCCQTGH